MEKYRSALKALHYLLIKTNVKGWANWIEKDLVLVDSGDVSHHLKAYGGMGSLNDIWICKDNGHDVIKLQEPYVQFLFEDLKAICFILASNIINLKSKDITIETMWGTPKVIQGFRCLQCGHSEITKFDILYYVLPQLIGLKVVEAYNKNSLIECIESVLNMEIDGLENEVTKLKLLINNSKIEYIDYYQSRMHPCPKCMAEDTAVYRWVKKENRSRVDSLEPAEDNLQLKF